MQMSVLLKRAGISPFIATYTVDIVDSLEKIIGRSAIGESLNECLATSQHGLACMYKLWKYL